MSETKYVKCPFDGYKWHTTSKMKMVTCPSCLNKFEADANLVQDEKLEMQHFNLNENGVRILDHNLHWIVDVFFKPDKVYCGYCKSSDCEHVKFALGLDEVQKILKKKGWKIEK
jgi:hypothetical protein